MKKLLSILLVLLLCLGIMTACGGGDNGNNDAALDGAVDAVEALFTSTNTAEDYDLAGSVTVDGVTYTVTWAISNTEGVSLDGNKVTVADKPATEIAYTLTATVADAEGNTKTATINLKVPAYVAQYNTWAEYVAAENGAALKVSGVVSAVLKNAFAIVNDGKAFIVKGTVADDIKVGVTVEVEGTKATDAAGNYSIAATATKVTNATATAVNPVDYTTIFTGAEGVDAEALVANQGLLVTIKQVTIGAYSATAKTAAFSLGENETYLSMKGLSPLTTAQINAIRDNHNDHAGDYIDVTGIIQIANGEMYLVAVDANAETNYTARVYTDAEKVALIKAAIKLDSVYALGATVTVPTAGEKGGTVAWASNNDAIAFADGKLTITIPNVYTEVTVTATINSGDVTEAVEYKVVLSSLENTIDVLKAAYALEAGKALPTTNKTLEGMVTVIDAAYAEATGVTLKLVVKGNNDYPITVTLKDANAANIVLGDTIMVTGQVKKNADGVVVLDGATLDKISSGGNKLTFDLALPGENVLFLNLKGSKTNTVTVVDDGGDKVLQINKVNDTVSKDANDKKQTAIDYFYPALSEGDDVYVFEAAITLMPDANNGGRFETCFYTTEGDALNKVFQVEYIFSNTAGSAIKARGYGKIGNSQVSTAEVATTAVVGTEFTVRMEYHVDETAPRTVVYINDARVIDTTTVFFAKNNGADTAPVTTVTHAELQAYTAYTGLVNIDDLNVYTYASTYTFDDTYENDQVFVDLKPWKKPLDKSGNNFEIVTDGANKYLKVNKVNSPETCQVAVDVFDPDNKEPERVNYATFSGKLNITRTSASGDFEILIRAEKDDDGINDPNDAQAKVAEVIIYFGAEGAMTAKLNGRSGGGSSSTVALTPKQGEWFTFELTYEVIGEKELKVTFKVNGEEVLAGNYACLDPVTQTARYDAKFAEIQAYTAFAGTILYDDLAVDFKSAPIDWTAAVPGAPTGDATSDIGTIGTANNADFTADKTTTAGWVAKNAQYIVDNATAGKPVIVLNGKKGAEGTFTSPVLNNGVSEVTFGYMALDTKEIALKVEILKDGNAVAANTAYLKVNKGAVYTFNWVLETPIGGDFQVKISNLALGKAEEDAELIAVWDVAYKVAALPNYADFDFEKEGDKTNLIVSGGNSTVADGKFNVNAPAGNAHSGFFVPNRSEKNVYSDVYQYVTKFDFTFNGAKVKESSDNKFDLNLAFVGFLTKSNTDTSYGNGQMAAWTYLTMVAEKKDGAEATAVTFFGLTLEKGKTYTIEIAYVVGSYKYVVKVTDAEGNVQTTNYDNVAKNHVTWVDNKDHSKGIINDDMLFGFNFYWRGGGTQRFTDASVTIDNAYIGIESAPNYGRNGISKYAENSINFNDRDDTTLVGNGIEKADGTIGGSWVAENVDTTKTKWNTIIGSVGSNKYLNAGHTNGDSVSVLFNNCITVEKDKEFKEDTWVYEFDFMYIQAVNQNNWQIKFKFSKSQDINMTVNYKPAVEAKDAVMSDDGTTVVTPAVEAQPAKWLFMGKEYDLNKWYTIRIEINQGDAMTDAEAPGLTSYKGDYTVYVNNEKIASSSNWGTFTWVNKDDHSKGKKVYLDYTAIDGTLLFNSRGLCKNVDFAIDNVYVGKHTAGYEPSLKDVETPVAGTAYKFYLDQVKADKTIFFKGEMNGFYYASTEDVLAATELYLEAAETEGEYYVYFMNGDVKTYLSLEEALNSKTNKMVCNVVFKTDKAAASKWVYNTTIKSITSTLSVDGAMKTYYLGTYKNYTTFSASELKYVVDAETGALTDAYGTSSFVAHFAIYE